MSMRPRLARLFTIKTRTEALFLTYAIAVGAIERGLHYMEQYPGYAGFVLAVACLGVPFIAGAKLIDSVKKPPIPARAPVMPQRRHDVPRFGRDGSNRGRMNRGSALRASRRRD
jgi:hypothetical protein